LLGRNFKGDRDALSFYYALSYLIKHHTPAGVFSSVIPWGYAKIWKMRIISGKI
jgi:hypothetical protein